MLNNEDRDDLLIASEWVESCLSADDEPRSFPNSLVTIDHEGRVSLAGLIVGPEDTFRYVAKDLLKPSTRELVFIMDRYAKENQGTTLDSVVTFYRWKKGEGWTCAIREYSATGPFEMKPLDFFNVFWIDAMRRELSRHSIRSPNGGRISTYEFV